jgi:hypothetical protein
MAFVSDFGFVLKVSYGSSISLLRLYQKRDVSSSLGIGLEPLLKRARLRAEARSRKLRYWDYWVMEKSRDLYGWGF